MVTPTHATQACPLAGDLRILLLAQRSGAF
jgi:hypothetical protein